MSHKYWEFAVETAQILAHPKNQNVDIVSWFPMPYIYSTYTTAIIAFTHRYTLMTPLTSREHHLALSLMSVGLKS